MKKYALVILVVFLSLYSEAQKNYSVHDSIQDHSIQELTLKFQKSKTAFKASGAAIATGGALMLFNASAKQPSIDSDTYLRDIKQYNANQRITRQVIAGCYIVAGVCLIWGVSISF